MLLLGQLIYTSFPGVGFKLLASPQVPVAAQQAFLQKLVHSHWDAYNPPGLEYRAAYVYQPTSKECLFGWLYNSGLDDFGRSHVPYFLCYHLAEGLNPSHLEAIFACLHKGPVALIDRQQCPSSLESIAAPNLWNYQPARIGVMIPAGLRDRSDWELKQGKLLDLFIPVVAGERGKPQVPLPSKGHHWSRDGVVAEAEATPLAPVPIPVPAQAYQQKLQRYEREYLQALEREYPLTDASRKHLARSQQDLGLTSNDIQKLEDQVACQFTAVQSLQQVKHPPAVQSSVTTPTRQSRLILGAGFTAAVLIVAILFGLRQAQHQPSQQLKAVKALAQAKNYNECVMQAQTIPQKLAQYTTAQRLLQQCQAGLRWQNVQVKTLVGHSDAIFSVALSSDGEILTSGSADRTIKSWNPSTGELQRTLRGHTDAVRSVAISGDSQTLASASGDNTIKVWNLETDELLFTLTGHTGPVWSVAISPDGQTLASASYDSTIKLWDLKTGKLGRTLTGHAGPVWSIAISGDGQTLASGSGDNTIKLWSLETGELLHNLSGHSDFVRSIAISPDGQRLASGSWDRTIKLWNLQTGELLRTFTAHTDRVTTVTFSPDGQTLASGSRDRTIKLWHLPSGELLRTLSGHTDWVISVAYGLGKKRLVDSGANSAEQQIVVSGSKDKTVRLWR